MSNWTNKRPKLKFQKQRFDYISESLSILALLILILIPIYHYNSSPDSIPSHFDLFGDPDDYARRGIVWLLPILGIILYTVLFFIQKIPHQFNYIVEITEENAERQYRLSIRLLQILKLIITSVLAFVMYASIMTAYGKWSGLGSYFMPVFMVVIFGSMVIYLVISSRTK